MGRLFLAMVVVAVLSVGCDAKASRPRHVRTFEKDGVTYSIIADDDLGLKLGEQMAESMGAKK